MTSKQRAFLRSLASSIEPVFQIGKENLSDNLLRGLDEALEKRELINVSVLKSCESSAAEVLTELCAELNACPVCAIGNRAVMYRRSSSDKVRHIEF